MSKTSGAYVVSWDFSHGDDVGVLIVGEEVNGVMTVVNAFRGQEAIDIYEKLSKVKKVQTSSLYGEMKATDA